MSYIQPCFPLLLLAALWGLCRLYAYRNRPKPVSMTVAAVLLFLFSWPPMAWLLSRPFEASFPPHTTPQSNADAIVVLASSMYPETPPLPAPRVGSDTFERCLYAAWLYKHWKAVPILASGGGSASEAPPYAMSMREALEREGVPASVIWLENRSRSTYENALYSAELLRAKGIHRIVLVTEAYHMLRSVKCFQKQSLDVIPAACGYRTYHGFHLTDMIPGWEPIAWNEDVLHESIGFVWYHIRGWV